MLRPLLIIALLFCSRNLFSQDTIVKITGEQIIAKVKTVNDDEVTYTRYSSPDGPEYTISTDEIWKIIYSDGTVEVYSRRSTNVKKETSQAPNIPYNFIGITLSDFIPGQVSVSFEHVFLKNELSFRIPLSLGVYNIAGRKPSELNTYYYYDPYKKYSIGLDLLYYAQRAEKAAYFLGASMETGKGTFGVLDTSSSVITITNYKYFGLGVITGFRFLVTSHVNIQIYWSIGMQLMSNNEDYRAMSRGGLVLGYVW